MKQLAFAFAKQKDKKIPSSWEQAKAAGEDWLKGFRRRNRSITLRQPEATSMARAMGFNKHNARAFFENIKELYESKGVIPPQYLGNLDETGTR